jgi:hypothetical protein
VYDWLLFLHVLAAFFAATAVVLFGALLVAGPATAAADPPTLRRLVRLALLLWAVGGIGVLVLGIWLAIYVKEYEPWDGWIAAAIVLWVIASAAGGRVSRQARSAFQAARTADVAPAAVPLAPYAVMAAAVAVLLFDMIFKPGA